MLPAAIVVIALTLKLMTALTCKRKDKHNYLTVQTQGYITRTQVAHCIQFMVQTKCTFIKNQDQLDAQSLLNL
jgi:hypothetical protein